MSGHSKCTCTPKTGFRNPDNMRVVHRNCNYSAFQTPKNSWHPSRFSMVVCIGQDGLCPMNYRTDKSVAAIPDLSKDEKHWMNSNTSQHKTQ
jgi:hypothetical protein